MTMKIKTVLYWTATALIAFALLSGGAAQLTHQPQNIEGLKLLGYPAYLATILGVWKLLGGVALLVPRFPRLKEWAYAGAFFDLTGAAASYALSDEGGKSLFHVMVPLGLAGIALVSWALRPPSRRLGGDSSEPRRGNGSAEPT